MSFGALPRGWQNQVRQAIAHLSKSLSTLGLPDVFTHIGGDRTPERCPLHLTRKEPGSQVAFAHFERGAIRN